VDAAKSTNMERHLVSIHSGHCLTDGFHARDLFSAPQAQWDRLEVQPVAAVREFPLGKGSVIVCQLRLVDGLMNSVAREFASRFLSWVRQPSYSHVCSKEISRSQAERDSENLTF